MLNKKYIVEKDDFEILKWTFMTYNDFWFNLIKKNCVFILLVFIEILVKNGSETNVLERKKLKSLSHRSHGVFLVRFEELMFLIRYYNILVYNNT